MTTRESFTSDAFSGVDVPGFALSHPESAQQIVDHRSRGGTLVLKCVCALFNKFLHKSHYE